MKIFVVGLLIFLLFITSCRKNDVSEQKYLPLEMINIPAGTFLIGSDKGYVVNESPRISINLNSFYISRYEITQFQYETIMKTNPSYYIWGDCPVEQVTWFDAINFCNQLSIKEGLNQAYLISDSIVIWNKEANGYRLPTEAEWEYACKAKTETDYYSGDMTRAEGTSSIDTALNKAGWYIANSEQITHIVGQKQPNAFGLYDMHGNVWEWCWDWFEDKSYLYLENNILNPSGKEIGIEKCLRGGSWFNNAFNCRSTLRYYANPTYKNVAVGFRIAKN